MSEKSETMPESRVRGAQGIGYIILSLVIGIIAMFLGSIYLFTPKIGSVCLAQIWIVILIELLSRVSKTVRRLSPATLVLAIFFPIMIYGGKTWWANGGQETNLQSYLDGLWGLLMSYNANPDLYKILTQYLPSYVIPHDFEALSAAWAGSATIPWSVWIGPIATWSIISIFTYLMSMFWSLGFLGPYWDEVDMLLFPLSIPTVYITKESVGNRDMGTGKSRLFNWSYAYTRAFWIAFIVGLLVSLPFVVAAFGYIVAPPWFGGYFGTYTVRLRSWGITTYILPGADTDGIILPTMIMICILLPYDFLFTIVLTWFLTSVVYNMLAVRLGWAVFDPNASFWYYGYCGPFPWVPVAYVGMAPGFTIWLLWRMRRRIVEIFKGGLTIQGVSARIMGVGFIVSFLLVLICAVVLIGVHPLIALLMLMLYILAQTTFARCFSECYIFGPVMMQAGWQLPFQLGQAIGIYQPVAAQQNKYLIAQAVYDLTAGTGNWHTGLNNSGIGIAGWTTTYKVFKESGVNFRDAIVISTILGVVLIPLTLAWWIYLTYHIGGSNLGISWFAGAQANNVAGEGILSTSYHVSTITPNIWQWFFIGVFLMLAICALREIFPWFPIHPTGVIFQLTGDPFFPWLNALLAIPLKYALFRTLGAKRTEEYIIPILAGFSLGANCLILVLHLGMLFTSGLPTISALWH